MSSSIGKGVASGASLISFFTTLAKGVGLIQAAIIASRFGTGAEVDAYTVAYSSIIFTLIVIPRDLLQPFLPLFTEVKNQQSEAAAWRFAGSVSVWTALLSGSAVTIGMIHTPAIARLVSNPNAPAETVHLTATLARLMFPAALFMALVWLGSLIMHAYKRFGLPAAGEILNRAITIGALLAFYAFWGIHGLAIGITLGTLAWFLLLVFGFGQRMRLFRPSLDTRSPAMRKLLRLMLPILFGTLVAQTRVILNLWFASGMGEGLPGVLGYAKRLSDTIVVLIPFAIGTAIYPFFSDMTANKNMRGASEALAQVLRLMALVFVPLSVAIAILRVPFVQLIFFRGVFTLSDVHITSTLLLFYTAGLVILAWEIMLMRFYFSAKSTLTPIMVGLSCVVLHVATISILKEYLGVTSIPIAEAFSKLVKVVILLLLFRRITPLPRLGENAVFLVKLGAASALMGIGMHILGQRLGVTEGITASTSLLSSMIQLGVPMALCAIVGLIIFAIACRALNIPETNLAIDMGRRFMAGRKK